MSFEIMTYYLIQAKSELIQKIESSLDPAFAGYLLRPVVIAKSYQADLPGSEREKAHENQIKRAFLTRLQSEIVWDSPQQFEVLFESSEMRSELFDHWWQLQETEIVYFSDFKMPDSEI